MVVRVVRGFIEAGELAQWAGSAAAGADGTTTAATREAQQRKAKAVREPPAPTEGWAAFRAAVLALPFGRPGDAAEVEETASCTGRLEHGPSRMAPAPSGSRVEQLVRKENHSSAHQ